MKKRTILAVLLVIGLFCAITACSGSSLSGKYVIADVLDDPEGITFAELDSMYKDKGQNVTDHLYLEFQSDNRFKLVLFGEEEAAGSFALSGNELTLMAGGEKSSAAVNGNQIMWEYENGAKLIFKK